MKKFFPLFIIFSLLVLLTACQAPKEKTPGWSTSNGEVRPGPKTGKAVLALLSKARQASKMGSLSSSESYLERALRIEPQNPTLWLYMAKLRLFAKKSTEAINLAKKAMALSARGGTASTEERNALQADCWRVIAHAYQNMDMLKKAKKAQAKANLLTN